MKGAILQLSSRAQKLKTQWSPGLRPPGYAPDYLYYYASLYVGLIYVNMYVCTAMRFVVLRGIELKLGMGVGKRPPRFQSIFRWTPPKVKGHPEVKLL